MGILGKKWDEERSDANKAAMRKLFDKVVPEGGSYLIGYGYSPEVRSMSDDVDQTSAATIQSLIVGWRESDRSIVVVPTTPDFDSCAEVEYYKRSEIKKAKTLAGEYQIVLTGGLKPKYTLFGLYPEYDEDYFAYIHQQAEWEAFTRYWKKYSRRW